MMAVEVDLDQSNDKRASGDPSFGRRRAQRATVEPIQVGLDFGVSRGRDPNQRQGTGSIACGCEGLSAHGKLKVSKERENEVAS